MRILVSAQDNHKITDGTVTGAARARLTRKYDPVTIAVDGPGPGGNGFGSGHESTIWDEDGISSPGPTRDKWRHPDTDLPMSVNPKDYIIEGTPLSKDDPEIADLVEPEFDQSVLDKTRPEPGDHVLIQKRKKWLTPSGPAPFRLTPPELAELDATHRLSLNRGRTIAVFNLRPTPPT